jgi:hypothetical protein
MDERSTPMHTPIARMKAEANISVDVQGGKRNVVFDNPCAIDDNPITLLKTGVNC